MGRKRTRRLDLPERVYHKNGAYYFVHITNKWERLDSDYAKAMARWAELVQPTASRSTWTIGALLDRYLLEVVPGKAERTQKDNRNEIKWLRTFFGHMVCSEVEPRHVAQYIDARSAATRANREIALLSHAFNKAILWGVVSRNPCTVPGLRNSEKARDRYVTDDEVETFKALCPDWLKHYIDIKLLTGLRQRDLLDLLWGDVTEQGISVCLNKTGKRMRITMTPELKALVDSLPRTSKPVFATRSGSTYTSHGFGAIWRRVMAKFVSTGNTRFTEHDLRGKVATDMGDAQAAKQLLGHKSVSMTEDYIKQRAVEEVAPHSRKKS